MSDPRPQFILAETRHAHGLCIAIRTIVFQVEQGVAIEIEVDDLEDTAQHILGWQGDTVFGTARIRQYAPGIMKIERVAVLKQARGKGLGLALMQDAIQRCQTAGPECQTIRIVAQDYAIPFYERLRFVVVGDGYMEAGIPHHTMERPLF